MSDEVNEEPDNDVFVYNEITGIKRKNNTLNKKKVTKSELDEWALQGCEDDETE